MGQRKMTGASTPALRTLGNSDLHLTPIGFGSWAISGAGWPGAWGPQDDKESVEAIHRALDLGINWVDTAALYGLGHSEEVVARALKTAAQKPFVFTKCGRRWRPDSSTPSGWICYNSQARASVTEELEGSLGRLGVETIDLYQFHFPSLDSEIEEGWETMARFREQGKVRWIGVSNYSLEQLRRIQTIAPITSVQPPYSILNRDIEKEILPFAQANGIGVLNYSPMVSGLLTGKMTAERIAAMPADDWRRRAAEFNEPRLSRNLQLVELLREIGSGHGVGPGVVAVAWTLHHKSITATIVGGRNGQQVEELAQALDFRLSDEEYARINDALSTQT